MDYQAIESDPSIQQYKTAFEAANIPWEESLQEAIQRAAGGMSVKPQQVVITIAARCLAAKLAAKAQTPGTTWFGRLWRIFSKKTT